MRLSSALSAKFKCVLILVLIALTVSVNSRRSVLPFSSSEVYETKSLSEIVNTSFASSSMMSN